MSSKSDKKIRAVKLRQQGHSLSEIAQLVGISKSTASLWLRDTVLGKLAQASLIQKKQLGRTKGQQVLLELRQRKQREVARLVETSLKGINYTPELCRLLCAYLYWAEGGKTGSAMVFMNSDVQLIRLFISLLRKAFILDEKKFKVLIHIHEYHNIEEILDYWSEATGIPRTQFFKPYHKENTGKNKKIGYKGSCSLRYYDVAIVRELKEIYNASSKHILETKEDE